ncbi:transporter substrate-binding domain-containing protein [Nocardiopsis lucentensis]|uniref:transporter substrate-binding domain-containing protein n=1 Tax=Nocardiopsis lucentensis TaxID=53441 RepID=UPI00034B3CF2|nr:transporter substrate-binding domain-containing protein [Nocardiopsis lucentensis]
MLTPTPALRTASAGLALAVLSACAPSNASDAPDASDTAEEPATVVVGVHSGLPSLGYDEGSGPRGFEVDVARYVAERVAGPDARIEFRGVLPPERDTVVRDGEVDMLFATYSALPERGEFVTFGGPYVTASQDTVVRAEDTSINAREDLAGTRVCKVEGSNSWRRITDDEGIDVELVDAADYPECLDMLVEGELDVVSTDDLVLAGIIPDGESDAYRFVNDPFTEERYSVALPKGDVETCQLVNEAIEEMYADGTALRLLEEWFGSTNLSLDRPLPEAETCV